MLHFPGFFIPFTYIPDLAEDYGMTSQQSAMLISIIGILNTVSRVVVGWVADRPWADALILNSVALVIGGASTMFVPYYASFGLMATYSIVFGIAIGMSSINSWLKGNWYIQVRGIFVPVWKRGLLYKERIFIPFEQFLPPITQTLFQKRIAVQ